MALGVISIEITRKSLLYRWPTLLLGARPVLSFFRLSSSFAVFSNEPRTLVFCSDVLDSWRAHHREIADSLRLRRSRVAREIHGRLRGLSLTARSVDRPCPCPHDLAGGLKILSSSMLINFPGGEFPSLAFVACCPLRFGSSFTFPPLLLRTSRMPIVFLGAGHHVADGSFDVIPPQVFVDRFARLCGRFPNNQRNVPSYLLGTLRMCRRGADVAAVVSSPLPLSARPVAIRVDTLMPRVPLGDSFLGCGMPCRCRDRRCSPYRPLQQDFADCFARNWRMIPFSPG